jgi:hypothetical protein
LNWMLLHLPATRPMAAAPSGVRRRDRRRAEGDARDAEALRRGVRGTGRRVAHDLRAHHSR